MVTRRQFLGTGLAVASMSGAIGLSSVYKGNADQLGLPKIGTMVIDEGLGVSTTLATSLVDFLHNRKADLSFLTLGLDAFAPAELKRLFNNGQMIAGISSGATLFCLERIAWDYRYRITRRSEHKFNTQTVNAVDNDAIVLALATSVINNQPESFAAAIAPTSRAYRPSRSDDTLHAWIMQTTVTSKQHTV